MTTNDALLFVGYEEDTGTVLSVAGVAVLGIRAPLEIGAMYTSKTPAGKKKFSGGADYDSGVARGYAECTRAYAATGPHPTILPTPPLASKEFVDGYMAGWEKCRREHRTILTQNEPLTIRLANVPLGHTPPAQISATQPYKPGPADAGPNASSSMFNLAIRGW